MHKSPPGRFYAEIARNKDKTIYSNDKKAVKNHADHIDIFPPVSGIRKPVYDKMEQ